MQFRERDGQCSMGINKDISIPFTENGFSLKIHGFIVKANIMAAIKLSYKASGPVKNLKFYKAHANLTLQNPSNIIRNLCAADFFLPHATCRQKGLYCKISISGALMDEIAYMSKDKAWKANSLLRLDNGYETNKICIKPPGIAIKFHADVNMLVCHQARVDAELEGVKYCKIAIQCLTIANQIASDYEKDTESCSNQVGKFEYGFYTNKEVWNSIRYEYTRTNATRKYPKHVF